MDAIETAKEKMGKTIAVLHKELSSLRAGRPNAQVLDRIMVDYYGTPTPVNQVGNISSPEARMLVITPYDPSVLNPLEKAIQMSDLGINPSNDGKCIRLIFPVLPRKGVRSWPRPSRRRVKKPRLPSAPSAATP